MSLPDPLLPLPDGAIHLPESLTGEERLMAALEQVADHVNLHAMAWPAGDEAGVLRPPPDDHVLHQLAHAHELVDEERLWASPQLGDVGILTELPDCDVCGSLARYDAVIELSGRRAGASLCPTHYLELGSGTLGASGDAYLMLQSEVAPWVQDACNALLAASGREPLF